MKRPILSYLVLSYGISWAVWFCIPLVADGNWTMMKILVGVGVGPGLAAVLLDRVRGTAGAITGRWWTYFAIVFACAAALNFWSLGAGDARTPAASAQSVGFTPLGVIASLLAAAVCGFIFASAATSRTETLSSITRWRAPLRWWATALFLPAAFLLISVAVAYLMKDEIPPMVRPLPYLIRAALFTFLVVGVGEEPGWRGWLLPELQKRWNPLVSSIFLGVVWGLWHFPLFVIGFYPGPPDAIIEYLFIGPLLAILFTWLFNRTGNLLLAIALHTAINNSSRWVPTTMLFPILLTGLVVVLIFTERMYRRRRA